jgi:hypothetical protein
VSDRFLSTLAHLRNKVQFANPASIIGPTWHNNFYILEIPERSTLAEDRHLTLRVLLTVAHASAHRICLLGCSVYVPGAFL